jgi:serine O-acetyltransferase
MFENIRADFHAYALASFTWIPDGRRRSRFARWLEQMNVVIFRESWLSVVLYRLQVWASQHHIPVLPFICDTINRLFWGVVIGRAVQIGPGLCFSHGNVVIDGVVKIGRDCIINPYVTIGLSAKGDPEISLCGPTIGDNVYIGTGARVLGSITVGNKAKIGANAVVLDNVPANFTAIGVPARVIPQNPPRKEGDDDQMGGQPVTGGDGET